MIFSLIIVIILLILLIFITKTRKLNYQSILRYFQTKTLSSSCWCCHSKQKHNNGTAITSNKERISKELIKSFSSSLEQNNNADDDDDDDDDGDGDVNVDDNNRHHMMMMMATAAANNPNDDTSDYYCDEDEDLMRQLQQPIDKVSNNNNNNTDYYIAKLNECLNETNEWYRTHQQLQQPIIQRSNIEHQHQHHHHEYVSSPENERLIPIRSMTNGGAKIQRQHNNKNHHHRSRNILKQQAIYASIALKNNAKTFEMFLSDDWQNNPNKNRKKMTTTTTNDLISLAEKGRIGKQISTDGSVSSETAAAAATNNNKRSLLLKRMKTNESSETNDSNNNENKYQTLNNYDPNNYDESDTQSSNLQDFSPNTTLSERNLTTTLSSSSPQQQIMMIKSGRLEISFAYDAPSKKLYVIVIQGDEIAYKDQQQQQHSNVCQIYVKIILLPHKKQKFRTKSKPIFCPVFDETFTFNRINPDEISNLGLRFRVFSVGFTRKTYLIGESRISFACIKPQQQETKLWFTLELPATKRNRLLDLESSSLARTDSTSSQSLQNSSPELLLSLAYNGTTGRLSVTMIKGSQFRSLSTRTPDTYIKLLLVSQNGNEMARGKTRVCRGQPNPLFRETFVFQVALFQLPDVTLMIFVYNKRSIKRKEMIGWISLGYNSSGDEELSHWNDMRDNKGEQVSRWHVLHEP
ncbi:Protein kinase C conserved region 2 (CalB) [Dermatophagoides farinae]|uniref:Protein kinase C conserved region 2 (CalB) n=1 Tax=Dermatophagoides farinae TaxID=6954 RepID=A0A922KZ85_DERFA|nr:Protein kinase C conserved region 2 (CalB) [Dermatophagoides farinae]